MTPEIGDIIDCRKVPEVGHFVLSLGERAKHGKSEIMYYIITSRVYAVFPKIVDFFNDCLSKDYKRFLVYFSKEKDKKDKGGISLHGRLRDAFFLDMESDYKGCLDTDSMIVVNESPKIADLETFKRWQANGIATYRNKLTAKDMLRFIDIIKCSTEISREDVSFVCRNYNLYHRSSIKKSGP
jgi:hypothetical protein